MDYLKKAAGLISEYKGDSYAFGSGSLERSGQFAAEYGKTALVIANNSAWQGPVVRSVLDSLTKNHVNVTGNRVVSGARPNSPVEDVCRLKKLILQDDPDSIVVVGGGSSIDAAKAANVLASLGADDNEIEKFYGMGIVTAELQAAGRTLKPFIAVETAAGSGSHLTKYSNVTDLRSSQKKLIIDNAIIPDMAVFDYEVTESASPDLTIDGALDGMSHCLEVYFGWKGSDPGLIENITESALELIFSNLGETLKTPGNKKAREALGLATDLGGYAIMVGGTNGGHLNSFSLVDVTTHGRACGILNPYYTVFFAPAIERQLKLVSKVLANNGYMKIQTPGLEGRKLGIAVAKGLQSFLKSIGVPVCLKDLPDYKAGCITRALEAAKNPQLGSKLKNMPVPLESGNVEEYMGPVLEAAVSGNFDIIKNIRQ